MSGKQQERGFVMDEVVTVDIREKGSMTQVFVLRESILVPLTEGSNPRRIKSILKGFRYGLIALTTIEVASGTTKLTWE